MLLIDIEYFPISMNSYDPNLREQNKIFIKGLFTSYIYISG